MPPRGGCVCVCLMYIVQMKATAGPLLYNVPKPNPQTFRLPLLYRNLFYFLYFLQLRQAGEEGGRWVEEGQEEVMSVTQANGEEIAFFFSRDLFLSTSFSHSVLLPNWRYAVTRGERGKYSSTVPRGTLMLCDTHNALCLPRTHFSDCVGDEEKRRLVLFLSFFFCILILPTITFKEPCLTHDRHRRVALYR